MPDWGKLGGRKGGSPPELLTSGHRAIAPEPGKHKNAALQGAAVRVGGLLTLAAGAGGQRGDARGFQTLDYPVHKGALALTEHGVRVKVQDVVGVYRGKGVQCGLVGGGVDGREGKVYHLAVDLRRSFLLGAPLGVGVVGKVDEHSVYLPVL